MDGSTARYLGSATAGSVRTGCSRGFRGNFVRGPALVVYFSGAADFLPRGLASVLVWRLCCGDATGASSPWIRDKCRLDDGGILPACSCWRRDAGDVAVLLPMLGPGAANADRLIASHIVLVGWVMVTDPTWC